MDNLLEKEIKFCEELEFEKNEHGKFIYESKNKKSIINLPCILEEYKEWLIEKRIVRK